MYDLIQLLTTIGLTEKEAKVYLISLKVGTNPASVIASRSELNRCTMYSLLESLIKKGLIYEIEKDTIKYFTPVSPRQLLMWVEEKQRDLSYHRNEVLSRISELDSLRHPNQVLPEIRSYSGKSGMNKLYNDAISEPFLLINAQPIEKPQQFFGQYASMFLNEKKTIHLTIRKKNKVTNLILTTPKDLESLPNCRPIEIIGKYKLFIVDDEDYYGIEIRQNRIIGEHQEQFHYLWNIKKDPRP
jgi:sugar-specific transcriptional regulator TrmB